MNYITKEDLRNLSDENLIDIVKNYKLYNYDEIYKLFALEILEERYPKSEVEIILSNTNILKNEKEKLVFLYKKFIFWFSINILTFFSIFLFVFFDFLFEDEIKILKIILNILGLFIILMFTISLLRGIFIKRNFDKLYNKYKKIEENNSIKYLYFSYFFKLRFLLFTDYFDIKIKIENL